MEPFVSYLYDEKKPLSFMEAVSVVAMAEGYHVLPFLIQALRRIQREKLEVHQALEVWKLMTLDIKKSSSEYSPKLVRDYCAALIQEQLADLESSEKAQELLSDMSQEDLVCLYNDLSRTIGVDEEILKGYFEDEE
ncbi:hypothetical protein CJU89_1591 [Yarrowia sp. B02]|nr:hypothetical protein CJU89_1591 [Yarrowia sp. B02]